MAIKSDSNSLLKALCAAVLLAVVASQVSAHDVPTVDTNKWEGSLAAGFTLTTGNSETVLGTLTFKAERKWEKDEWLFGANLAYGENSGDKSTELADAAAQYNRLLTERVYVGFRVNLMHDDIADIYYRLTLGPNLGVYIIKEKDHSWKAEAGPSFVREKTPKGTSNYIALRLAERSDHKINERVKAWQQVEFLPQVDDFSNFIVNTEVGVEAELNKKLALRVVFLDTYDNEPAPSAKNRNDVKVITALAYKF